MTKADSTPTTPARWPAPIRSTDNPKPVPPIWDPTRRPPPPPSGRRGLLSSAAAAVLGGALVSCVPPGAVQALPDQFPAHGGRAAQTNPDAELLALCAEYTALDRALIQNGREDDNFVFGTAAQRAHLAKAHALVDRLHELEELIADTAPQTREGLLAKAEAARRSLVSDGDDAEGGELMEPDSYLACTVIENLLGMIGGQA